MKIGLREIIFFKLMLGLLLASYFFGLKRMGEKKLSLEQDITIKQQRLADLARASRDIEDMTARLGKLQQAIQVFEKKLPAEQEVDSILSNVTTLVERHKLHSKSFKPNPKAVVGPNFRERQIELTLSGNFFGFYAFLRDLERLERIIKITDMKLTRIDDQDGQMQAVMKLSIFFDPASGGVASTRE
jgi:type IV pilus assembly protein PilO